MLNKPVSDYKLTVISEATSFIHGKLLVTKNPILGLNIINDHKIVQSGDVMEKTWKRALSNFNKNHHLVKKCLILGFGGGGVARVVYFFWPDCSICGVEVDPVMLELGRKYLGLSKIKAEIIMNDAYEYCCKAKQNSKKYDLIIIDLYIGSKIPSKFESIGFLRLAKQLLSKSGVVIFNKIASSKSSKNLKNAMNKAFLVFDRVDTFSFQRNYFLTCSK